MNVRILISAMLCFLLIGYGVKLQAEPTESLPVEAGVIRGKVIDAKTREPMQFVNISVRKAGTTVPLKGMVTDETGTFHIAQLPEGSYTLSISFIGYKTIEKRDRKCISPFRSLLSVIIQSKSPLPSPNRYRESISGTCYCKRTANCSAKSRSPANVPK